MSLSLGRRRSRSYYWFWSSAFVVLVLLCVGMLYYASQSVNYVWRWYRMPQYFWTERTVDVRSEIMGEVSQIVPAGKSLEVTVQSEDGEEETYTIPSKSVRVAKGDFIYPGDVLGDYHVSQPGILLEGLWVTLKVSFIAILFGVVIGLLTGLARLSDNPTLRWCSVTYIELVRGSPLLVQIFIWYFVFGTLINDLLSSHGIPQIPPLWFGVASLAFFSGAYVAEIVRAGIQSVHRGQMEAARSLGMSTGEAMRHVVLPQAFRRILPPLAGQFISLVKDSSLLGIIAVRELTKATREVVTTSLQPFELWLICAALYLILTFALSLFAQYLERRMVA